MLFFATIPDGKIRFRNWFANLTRSLLGMKLQVKRLRSRIINALLHKEQRKLTVDPYARKDTEEHQPLMCYHFIEEDLMLKQRSSSLISRSSSGVIFSNRRTGTLRHPSSLHERRRARLVAGELFLEGLVGQRRDALPSI